MKGDLFMAEKKARFKKAGRPMVKPPKLALDKPDKTVIKALALGGMLGGGAPCAVDVKDDKIIRVRPFHYDWKYKPKEFNPWKIKRNGKVLTPHFKSQPSPFSLAYKKRTYSPNRIKYPLIIMARGTRRTGARASFEEFPGMRRQRLSPVRSKGSTRNTDPAASWSREMAMGNARVSIPPMETRPCSSIRWEALPSR
jgi:hypothetical protein